MVNWYSENMDFYAMTTSVEENVITTTFESGKSRYYLKNSAPKKTHAFSFLLKDTADEVAFWNWYNNDLLSRTQTVKLINLVTLTGFKEYRITSEPAIQDSQYPKEVQINVKEE